MLYTFRCDQCSYRWEEDLPIGTDIDDCPKCEEKGSVSKLLPEFSLKRDESVPLTKKTGEEMKEHIDENKKILEEMKNEVLEFK